MFSNICIIMVCLLGKLVRSAVLEIFCFVKITEYFQKVYMMLSLQLSQTVLFDFEDAPTLAFVTPLSISY